MIENKGNVLVQYIPEDDSLQLYYTNADVFIVISKVIISSGQEEYRLAAVERTTKSVRAQLLNASSVKIEPEFFEIIKKSVSEWKWCEVNHEDGLSYIYNDNIDNRMIINRHPNFITITYFNMVNTIIYDLIVSLN